MGKRGLSQGSNQIIPPSLALYEEYSANGESLYLDTDDFSDIIHYYLTLKLYDKAEEAIDKALAIHPTSWKILIEKAYLLFDAENIEECKVVISSIIEQNEEEVILLKADVELCEDNISEALKTLSKLKQKYDLNTITNIFYLLMDYDLKKEAREWLDFAKEKYGNKQELIAIKADLDLAEGEYTNALASFEKLISHDSFNEDYFWGHAKCYFAMGNYQACINSCLFALALNSEHDEYLHLLIGQSYQLLDNLTQAKAYYKKYSELSSTDKTTAEEAIERIEIDLQNIAALKDLEINEQEVDLDDFSFQDGGFKSLTECLSCINRERRDKYYPADQIFSQLQAPEDIANYLYNSTLSNTPSSNKSIESTPLLNSIKDEINSILDTLSKQFGCKTNKEESSSKINTWDACGSISSINEILNNIEKQASEESNTSNIIDFADSIETDFKEIQTVETRDLLLIKNVINLVNEAANAGDHEECHRIITEVDDHYLPLPVREVLVDLAIANNLLDTAGIILFDIELHDNGLTKVNQWRDALINFSIPNKKRLAKTEKTLGIKLNKTNYPFIEDRLRELNLNYLADYFHGIFFDN